MKRYFDDGFTGLVEIQEIERDKFIIKPKENLFVKAKLKGKKVNPKPGNNYYTRKRKVGRPKIKMNIKEFNCLSPV